MENGLTSNSIVTDRWMKIGLTLHYLVTDRQTEIILTIAKYVETDRQVTWNNIHATGTRESERIKYIKAFGGLICILSFIFWLSTTYF